MTMDDHDVQDDMQEAEQIQIARQIGSEITEVFVGFVRGNVAFDALTFSVFDAMHDLAAVAAGDYELEEDDEHDHEALEEQEDLAQEPSRDGGGA